MRDMLLGLLNGLEVLVRGVRLIARLGVVIVRRLLLVLNLDGHLIVRVSRLLLRLGGRVDVRCGWNWLS